MAGILMTDPGFGRGHTLGVKDPEQGTSITGTQKTFTDSDPRTTHASQYYSNRAVTCLALRNVSGAPVAPGTVVAFTAEDILNSFDSVAADAGGLSGVVDEYLPATGVADQDVCWVVVSGPTAVSTADATIAAGDELAVGTGAVAPGEGGVFAISGTDSATMLVRALVGAASEHSLGGAADSGE